MKKQYTRIDLLIMFFVGVSFGVCLMMAINLSRIEAIDDLVKHKMPKYKPVPGIDYFGNSYPVLTKKQQATSKENSRRIKKFLRSCRSKNGKFDLVEVGDTIKNGLIAMEDIESFFRRQNEDRTTYPIVGRMYEAIPSKPVLEDTTKNVTLTLTGAIIKHLDSINSRDYKINYNCHHNFKKGDTLIVDDDYKIIRLKDQSPQE